MFQVAKHPKIYHITHVRNLPQIVATGWLYSDARRIEKKLNCDVVGMSHIKRRRLTGIEVACHPGTHVGDYVPFYFCPRSIMLYILHRGNHPDLNYTEGQEPIVHLQADLAAVIQWASGKNRAWAFSDRNAGAFYSQFFNQQAELGNLNWDAIKAAQWSDAAIKDGKQAEFLVLRSFPWHLVECIGVHDANRQNAVRAAMAGDPHQPVVEIKPNWYY